MRGTITIIIVALFFLQLRRWNHQETFLIYISPGKRINHPRRRVIRFSWRRSALGRLFPPEDVVLQLRSSHKYILYDVEKESITLLFLSIYIHLCSIISWTKICLLPFLQDARLEMVGHTGPFTGAHLCDGCYSWRARGMPIKPVSLLNWPLCEPQRLLRRA